MYKQCETEQSMARQRELERGLLEAQCYHAGTPQQAVYLFLRAVKERNLFYRMAVTPKEDVAELEAFAASCLAVENEEDYGSVDCWDASLYCAIFPKEMFGLWDFWIYNMQCDEAAGSATVWVELDGEEKGVDYVRWQLDLVNEDGWKVLLREEGGRQTRLQEEVGGLTCPSIISEHL